MRRNGDGMARLDTVTISGLRVHANHGVFDFERRDGQLFVVDVKVWIDMRSAAADDDLSGTVDYGVLATRIAAAVASDPVDLIETVAERVAAIALGFGAVERVRATVHKPDAPIGLEFDDVAVTVTRKRA